MYKVFAPPCISTSNQLRDFSYMYVCWCESVKWIDTVEGSRLTEESWRYNKIRRLLDTLLDRKRAESPTENYFVDQIRR